MELAGVAARTADGAKVAIIFFNSDALFTVDSVELSGDASTAALNAVVLVIRNHFPNATIEVRGHTDAQGTATSNQNLSEQRAAAVKGYLNAQGLDPSRVSNAGFGSTQPVVLETNPDGSDNPAGRAFNRRVEIVIDSGEGTRNYEVTATRAGRRVEITNRRGIIEVSEVTRTGTAVRTARFMASRVVALVEHPADTSGLA